MTRHKQARFLRHLVNLWLCLLAAALLAPATVAGPLRDRIDARRAAQESNDPLEENSDPSTPVALPADIRIVRDVSYGSEALQRFDVYIPRHAKNAPVIFMVHGGAWAVGDKGARGVVENKVVRWLPKGFIVVSANYRMLPKAAPLDQARDVARALAKAQQGAAAWGGDRSKFILMGHSAGAHLVTLLSAAPALAGEAAALPWLGTVVLDSAAMDVVQIMEGRHMRLYDRAFGRNPEYWKSVSPIHAMHKRGAPMLVVCSSRRSDACSQAEHFVTQAASLGTQASVLREDLSHRDINRRLGEEKRYTENVETFMRTLDLTVARLLVQRSNTASARP